MIVYDVKSLPCNMNLSMLRYLFEETKILFFDSSLEGKNPYFLDNELSNTLFVDINTLDGIGKYKSIREKLLNEYNSREEDNQESG